MATIAIRTGSTTVDPYGMVGDFNAPAQTAKKSDRDWRENQDRREKAST